MLENQLFNREKFEAKLDAQVADRTNPLVYMVYQLDKQNQQYEHNITSLEKRLSKIEEKLNP